MARIEKTVFISYRRTDVYVALAVYQDLKSHGYDVFFDYKAIHAGDFEQIIINDIKARAHFLVVLTPTALDRCDEPGDWLRREIETAIDEKRNIIPLFFKGFRFGDPSVSVKLTGKLGKFKNYNGLEVPESFFEEAMDRLRTDFLNTPFEAVLHPASAEVKDAVKEIQIAADKALEINEVKEKVDQVVKKQDRLLMLFKGIFLLLNKIKLRRDVRIIILVIIIVVLLLSATFLFPNSRGFIYNLLVSKTPTPTNTPTFIPTSTITKTLPPTLTSTITKTPTPSRTPTITLTPTETPTPTDTLTPTPAPVLSVGTGSCAKFAIGIQCWVRVGISWVPVDKTNRICVYVQSPSGRLYKQTDFSYFPDRTGYTVTAYIGDGNTPAGQTFTIHVVEMPFCNGGLNGTQRESITITR